MGRKPYESGTIRDSRGCYGHDPDLFVLRLVWTFADSSLDFREILDYRLASASFLYYEYVPRVSANVQLASMQADVVCTSRTLEHWHVVFVNVHPTAGMVCDKQLSCPLN